MKKRDSISRTKFILLNLIFVIIFSMPGQAQEKPKLGDISDGSKAVPVHLIDLYDAEGSVIRPGDTPMMPFSTKQTCLQCHDYQKISSGWHFNADDPGVDPGRPGEPWILVDYLSAIQLPLSHRKWSGTYPPETMGLTPWYFVQQFGRHLPGGGVGENDSSDATELYVRWMISGKLEINCLSCHDAEASHDQAEYARNTKKQNFRWAAAATCGFATVRGSARDMPDNYDIYHGVDPDAPRKIPPSVVYNESRFNPQGKVFFDIVEEIPKQRCYFCHSTALNSGEEKEQWHDAEDVHLAAGLKCVNCHRNGLNHDIVRGYEKEAEQKNDPALASLTCKGCHIGDDAVSVPNSGHYGAPKPKHVGLPVIHFEKLSCTACHSGNLPDKKAILVKTSKSHALGTHTTAKEGQVLPYILSPVFTKGEDGKIAPHNLIVPAYWAFMNGDSIRPIAPNKIRPVILAIIAQDTLTDSTNYSLINSGKWPQISEDKLIATLDSLITLFPDQGTPVYIAGGKLYQLTSEKKISEQTHQAASPYSWPLAHNVRPAAQALGVNGCSDCHTLSSPFLFGKVVYPTPLTFTKGMSKSMPAFHKAGTVFSGLFAMSFFFRPWLKLIMFLSCLVILIVLMVYMFKGADKILRTFASQNW